mmetsp:Transcript_11713/g.41832  ORF Transcript_11713/g.41832 Transcript_11713/m.41832 type:complete len:118 (+) Transcript_11713:3497-3850(+)
MKHSTSRVDLRGGTSDTKTSSWPCCKRQVKLRRGRGCQTAAARRHSSLLQAPLRFSRMPGHQGPSTAPVRTSKLVPRPKHVARSTRPSKDEAEAEDAEEAEEEEGDDEEEDEGEEDQ